MASRTAERVALAGIVVAVAAAAFFAGRSSAKAPDAVAAADAEDTDSDASDSDSDSDSDEVDQDVELKMVVCVRSDLNMSKGKIAAQVGHAVLACYRRAQREAPHWVKAWLHRAQAKITLKVDNEAQMDAVAAAAAAAGIPFQKIEDAGRTEVEPGTFTVLGLGPAPKALIDQITGPKGSISLRLLT